MGVVGYLLPIPIGIFFLLLGALLLSRDIPFFARMVRKFKSRFPKIGRRVERFRNTLTGEQ